KYLCSTSSPYIFPSKFYPIKIFAWQIISISLYLCDFILLFLSVSNTSSSTLIPIPVECITFGIGIYGGKIISAGIYLFLYIFLRRKDSIFRKYGSLHCSVSSLSMFISCHGSSSIKTTGLI